MRMIQLYVVVFTLTVLKPITSLAVPFEDPGQNGLWFEPASLSYDYGDKISVNLYADILEQDAIWGFSFDLSFDGGATAVTPGSSGDFLTFSGFTADPITFDFPFFDDGDGIGGEIPFFNPDPYWGGDILLGTFYFTAPDSGPIGEEIITLTATNLACPFGDEGLIVATIGADNLMPNNPSVTVSPGAGHAPIPEPGTALLLGAGLFSLIALKRKKK